MTSLRPPVHVEPWWEVTPAEDGLVLHLGERSTVAPAQVAAVLLKRQQATGDVAADVLRLDAHLRDVERRAAAKVAADLADVVRLRRLQAELGRAWFARARRAALRAEVEDARLSHADASRIHAEVVALKGILRSFVSAMRPPEGLLADAAAGWMRSPAVPSGVSVFEDVSYFLADTRREAAPDGLAGTIRGEDFGELWRREGDDPVEQPLARAGCWLVGHIRRTGEIYAIRRCETQTREVWLLGRGFSAARAYALLTPLMARMQEPNSLILVADEVLVAAHEHRGGRA